METLSIISLHEAIKLNKNNPRKIEKIINKLKSFKCTKNKDEEDFIHNKALEFDRQNITRTYLLINENNEIKAYFSIGLKAIEMKYIKSIRLRKLLRSYLQSSSLSVPAYLIGHFSKDDSLKESGYSIELMKYIDDIILGCNNAIGGRVIYLECEEIQKLKQVYENNKFNILFTYTTKTNKQFNVYFKII